MAQMSGHSGSNNFSKVQDAATDMVNNTIDVIRSASFTLKEKLDESGMTEYSQKLAAKVMNEGIPTVTQKLKELIQVCWKLFVEFLDSKGYKQPLEQYLIKFRDSPVVKTIWKVLQQMFSMLWVAAVKIYASFSDKQGKADMSTNVKGSAVDGALTMNGDSSLTTTPQPTASGVNMNGQNVEGRVTPQSAVHFDSGAAAKTEKSKDTQNGQAATQTEKQTSNETQKSTPAK